MWVCCRPPISGETGSRTWKSMGPFLICNVTLSRKVPSSGINYVVACAGAVNLGIAPILLAVVDETAPDNVTAAGGHGIGQHVCAVGLVATRR